MSKLKSLKVKNENGFDTAIDIGANAANVNLADGTDLETKIGNLDTSIESAQRKSAGIYLFNAEEGLSPSNNYKNYSTLNNFQYNEMQLNKGDLIIDKQGVLWKINAVNTAVLPIGSRPYKVTSSDKLFEFLPKSAFSYDSGTQTLTITTEASE